jgi:hypothetical protein
MTLHRVSCGLHLHAVVLTHDILIFTPWQLLLKVAGAPHGKMSPAHGAHHASRTAAAVSSVQHASAKNPGTANPLFVSAVVAAKAGAAKSTVAGKGQITPSSKLLRHQTHPGKAAVKAAAVAKSQQAARQRASQGRKPAHVARVPLHTAMKVVETAAASSLAQADKNAVEAALLRATLSVPGVRTAEKAAAAAAARAAANKRSAAWLAGAKSLAYRNPYASMNLRAQQQFRQLGGNLQRGRRGASLATRARAKLGAYASRRKSMLSHTGYSEAEDEGYVRQAGQHAVDEGGNAHMISTIAPNEEGEIERPDYNNPTVRKTRSIGTPVKPEDVKPHWAHGYYHPFELIHRADRYVPVGRLLTHRDGVTRREQKMPTMQEEEVGGAAVPEEAEEDEEPEEEEEEEGSCEWGKDVYGRCYKECTPSKEDYTLCHDDEPIWKDPLPLSKMCENRTEAEWCQGVDGEDGEEEAGNEPPEDSARSTVQLASMLPQGNSLGGNAPVQNGASAPTLAGGVAVQGGKVVWLPLDSLTEGHGVTEERGMGQAHGGVRLAGNTALPPARAVDNPPSVAPVLGPHVPKWNPEVSMWRRIRFVLRADV